MAKFFGEVGYGEAVEDPEDSGIWVDTITERKYQGDVLRITKTSENGDNKVNADISVNNRISVVADEFAYDNFFSIIYIKWGGVYWTVTSVEVQKPRLILSLGSVYNGPTS